MASTVMDLIGDHHCGLPRKRMEWIGDLNLTSQAPGIMTSRWTAADSAPPPCTALIVTAKLNDVDPQAWLADVLTRIADHPAIAPARAAALELDAPAPASRRLTHRLKRSARPRSSPDAYVENPQRPA